LILQERSTNIHSERPIEDNQRWKKTRSCSSFDCDQKQKPVDVKSTLQNFKASVCASRYADTTYHPKQLQIENWNQKNKFSKSTLRKKRNHVDNLRKILISFKFKGFDTSMIQIPELNAPRNQISAHQYTSTNWMIKSTTVE